MRDGPPHRPAGPAPDGTLEGTPDGSLARRLAGTAADDRLDDDIAGRIESQAEALMMILETTLDCTARSLRCMSVLLGETQSGRESGN